MKAPEAPKAEPKAEKPAAPEGMVTIDDFFKTKLVAAKVLECEKVEGSDKLLKFTLDIGGGETRTVLSGIAKWYKPDELKGKTLILVKNLTPRKMKGILSEGMLLSADDGEGGLKLLTVDGGEIKPGSEVG